MGTTTTKHSPTQPKLVRLSDVKAEPVRWLWPGRIPFGLVSLLVGDPGLGKSFITADIAARVSRPESKWPDGGRVPHGDSIILSSEDSPSNTIRPRIEAMGGDVNRVHALPLDGGMVTLNTPSWRAEMDHAATTGAVRVLILDPLISFVGDANTWKDGDVRRVMDP